MDAAEYETRKALGSGSERSATQSEIAAEAQAQERRATKELERQPNA